MFFGFYGEMFKNRMRNLKLITKSSKNVLLNWINPLCTVKISIIWINDFGDQAQWWGGGGRMIYGNKTEIATVLIRVMLWKLKYCFNVPEKN